MKVNQHWVKRRWLDFRNGHSIYLIFVIAFLQFTIIAYTLAIERLPLLKEVFPSMSYWIVFFVFVYVPLAVIIGHIHLKRQKPTEDQQLITSNPYTYQTAPGKEQLYTLPANRMQLELRLKEMEIRNRDAEIFERIFGQPFSRYSKEDFEEVKLYLEITKRLQNGERITDILAKTKSV